MSNTPAQGTTVGLFVDERFPVGTKVKRVQGRPETKGHVGTVTAIIGAMTGRTVIEVTEADGTKFECYTDQVKAI